VAHQVLVITNVQMVTAVQNTVGVVKARNTAMMDVKSSMVSATKDISGHGQW
jgi:hypothetical protein